MRIRWGAQEVDGQEETCDPRLGFEEPFPMADPGPGVAEIVQLYSQYAEHLQQVELLAQLQGNSTSVTVSTGADPD